MEPSYMIGVGTNDEKRMATFGSIFDARSQQLIEQNVPKGKGMRILNVGCGNGENTIAFAQKDPTSLWVGADNSPEQIALAHEKQKKAAIENVKWHKCDVHKLADLKETYPELVNVAYIRFLLTNLPDPQGAVDAILKMIKPGGLLIIEEIGKDGIPVLNSKSSPPPESTIKAMDAFWKMIKLQHQLQKSHLFDTNQLVLEHLKGKVDDLTCDRQNFEVTGVYKKSAFRLATQQGISKMKELGMISWVKDKMGYDTPEQWIADLKAFEKDDGQTLTFKNCPSIIARKRHD